MDRLIAYAAVAAIGGVMFLVKLRRKLALLATQIGELRAQALRAISYRPVGPGDEALTANLGALAAVTREAEQLGLTMLGDLVEEGSVRKATTAMRWFHDASGTVFGWMAPIPAGGSTVVVVALRSDDEETQASTTRVSPHGALAPPPFVRLQLVPLPTSLAETLAKHRAFAGTNDPARTFRRVTTLAELGAEIARTRAKVSAWRTAQPADQLLDADLRGVLGAQYAKLGAAMTRRLR